MPSKRVLVPVETLPVRCLSCNRSHTHFRFDRAVLDWNGDKPLEPDEFVASDLSGTLSTRVGPTRLADLDAELLHRCAYGRATGMHRSWQILV